MFKLVTNLSPKGDQPKAIEKLTEGIKKGLRHQVLIGVTGSGKTFTIANVIANVQKPTLVIAPNKTLAAQLYGELKKLFPYNAVEYFVSYYDYYQPEAYIPQTDTYIQKDASINEYIDKLRHSATRSLLERDDVIIVASVSCIYGLGSPEAYHGMILYLEVGDEIGIEKAIKKLVEMQYVRNEWDFKRGTFRVRGDILDIYPVYEEDKAVRIVFFDEEVEEIKEIDPLTGRTIRDLKRITIFPATHYVTTSDIRERAIRSIKEELRERIKYFEERGRFLEAQRIKERTLYDLEMIMEVGYCHGIENYSRHFTGRAPGEPPPTLLDYFPKDFLTIIDESHITIPQLIGMYRGDRSRKETLVEYGFRLLSALDNRPLRFDEFEERINQVIYVSATPGPYELSKAEQVVEQIIRPTGLVDPEIIVRPARNQIDDLIGWIRDRIKRNERCIVITLTKRMAEDLTEYLLDIGIKARYIHSDMDALERVAVIRDLRMGVFDVIVGINLLREGLDLPEVSLVAILDADKEGFLRSERSIIQICGRAARNVNGTVILYADRITESMRRAIEESNRRRRIQLEYNKKHGITPETIKKEIDNILESVYEADYVKVPEIGEEEEKYGSIEDMEKEIERLKEEMKEAAKRLEFEKAALLRDKIKELEKKYMEIVTYEYEDEVYISNKK